MYFPFETLSKESRVWVYAGSRPFIKKEEEEANTILQLFCEQWVAHGHPLKTSFRIEKNQFIIMAVDEDFHSPSGCSIDSSVAVLRKLHALTGIDFLNRSQVAFYVSDTVIQLPLTTLKQKFAEGQWHAQTLFFNTLVTTKSDFEKQWLIPAEKTWLVKYLPKPVLNS